MSKVNLNIYTKDVIGERAIFGPILSARVEFRDRNLGLLDDILLSPPWPQQPNNMSAWYQIGSRALLGSSKRTTPKTLRDMMTLSKGAIEYQINGGGKLNRLDHGPKSDNPESKVVQVFEYLLMIQFEEESADDESALLGRIQVHITSIAHSTLSLRRLRNGER